VLVQTSQWASIARPAFRSFKCALFAGALAGEGVSCAPFDVWLLFLSIGHLNSHNSILVVPAQCLGLARDSDRE